MKLAHLAPIPARSVTYEHTDSTKSLTLFSVSEPDLVTTEMAAATIELHRQAFNAGPVPDGTEKSAYQAEVQSYFNPDDSIRVKQFYGQLQHGVRHLGAQAWFGFESDAKGVVAEAASPISYVRLSPTHSHSLKQRLGSFGQHDVLVHPLVMQPSIWGNSKQRVMAAHLKTIVTDANFSDDSKLRAELLNNGNHWTRFVCDALQMTMLHRSNKSDGTYKIGNMELPFTTFDNRSPLQQIQRHVDTSFVRLVNNRHLNLTTMPSFIPSTERPAV